MTYRQSPTPAPLVVVSTSVTALDRQTGKVLWTHELERPARRFSIQDTWIVVLDARGDLYAIELATGTRVGFVATRLAEANAFVFDGERFYVMNDDTVVAVDWHGGPLWSAKIPGNRSWSLAGLAVGEHVVQVDFSRSSG